jgi:hypothetical protein
MKPTPLYIREDGPPHFLRQDYFACEETKNCVLRYRSEIHGREPERPMPLGTGDKEGWNGIFALPAAYAGTMDTDIVRAADWLKAMGRKQEARSLLARTSHFRSGGNPTGKSLYGMVKTLSEVEDAMISAYQSPVQTKPTYSMKKPVKTGARAAYEAAQAKPAPVKTGERAKGDEAR